MRRLRPFCDCRCRHLLLALCTLWCFTLGCSGSVTSPPPPAAAQSPSTAAGNAVATKDAEPKEVPIVIVPGPPGPIRFEEVAKKAGIDFVHFSGMTAERHYPTANGSGVAIFDYDGDGKMDLYFASCNLLAEGGAACDGICIDMPHGKSPVSKTGAKRQNKLYHNLGGGKFEDVTEKSGLGFQGFCHGIIVGDLDNDGDADVFLCNYGPNVLYLNNGDGTFKDVSRTAGINVPSWSSGGALLDFDDDGDLDIYVANYGVWDIKTDGENWCGSRELHIRQYCSPVTIAPTRHFLYRNNGVDKDGVPQFTDVTAAAGIARNSKDTLAHGFGVVTADVNGDGKIDIYVGNDQNPSFLFLNQGNGKFEDVTEKCGAAYNAAETKNPAWVSMPRTSTETACPS